VSPTVDYQHLLGPNQRCYICGEWDPITVRCETLRRYREECAAAEARSQFTIAQRPASPQAREPETDTNEKKDFPRAWETA